MASTDKEPVMVQVDLEKFIEDLWKMADDDNGKYGVMDE